MATPAFRPVAAPISVRSPGYHARQRPPAVPETRRPHLAMSSPFAVGFGVGTAFLVVLLVVSSVVALAAFASAPSAPAALAPRGGAQVAAAGTAKGGSTDRTSAAQEADTAETGDESAAPGAEAGSTTGSGTRAAASKPAAAKKTSSTAGTKTPAKATAANKATTANPVCTAGASAPSSARLTTADLRRVVDAVKARPVAAFLGDSFASGYRGAGEGAAGWPAIVSHALGLTELNLSVPGTGFVNPGWTGEPIGSLVARVIAARPSVVFIAGGHNDQVYRTSAAIAAAERVIRRLHAALPDAILVVVGPVWQNGSPPLSMRVLRNSLRATAAAVGGAFVDPLADRWFSGATHRLIGPDGLHPTNEGHAFMASRILVDLRGDRVMRDLAGAAAGTQAAASTTAATSSAGKSTAASGATCAP